MPKNIPSKVQKGSKTGLFVSFGKYLCAWIRIWIRIPNMDPDPYPGQTNECGLGKDRIRIRNTD
jgi:hypothetical protein